MQRLKNSHLIILIIVSIFIGTLLNTYFINRIASIVEKNKFEIIDLHKLYSHLGEIVNKQNDMNKELRYAPNLQDLNNSFIPKVLDNTFDNDMFEN